MLQRIIEAGFLAVLHGTDKEPIPAKSRPP